MDTQFPTEGSPEEVPFDSDQHLSESHALRFQNSPKDNPSTPGGLSRTLEPSDKKVTPCAILGAVQKSVSPTEIPTMESSRLELQSMPAPKQAPFLLPFEHEDIRIDVNELLANGDEWMVTPNTKFGGRRPLDLIGTPDESLLRETLRSAIYSGMA
jgi:Protein of unknown function (DUF2384)